MKTSRLVRCSGISLVVFAAFLSGAGSAVFGTCGPFTDTADDVFCPFVLEIFYLGITTGTSPTTYDPTSNVNRLQMAAFLSRTVDGVLERGSRRAALGQFWTPKNSTVMGMTTVGSDPNLVASDGADLWVASYDATVSRVRASDGKLLETWTGATRAYGVLVAMGSVFVAGTANPGILFRIDPSQAAGAVTTIATNLGNSPFGIAFDGSRIWTANGDIYGGSVSIVTPGATLPWTVTTVTGFFEPNAVLFDGASLWVTVWPGRILKLDDAGGILQTVTVGAGPSRPTFDGTNIWVPNANSNSVSVVRASSGAVLATLTSNGMDYPLGAAFDGQRILVTDFYANRVSLWKAADLTPLGSFPIGPGGPYDACSDGTNFWLTVVGTNQLVRF